MSDDAAPAPPIDEAPSSQPPPREQQDEQEAPRSKSSTASRDIVETTINGGVHVLGSFFANASPVPEWVDPARPIDLPGPLPPKELTLDAVIKPLREQRVVVVECLWSEHQWLAAASVVAALGEDLPCACGEVTDDSESVGLGAPAAGVRRRFGPEDLERAELGGSARVLLLELDGAAGSSYLDALFASDGSYRVVTAALRRADRYLLLLPRGGTRSRALSSRALAARALPRLSVPHLDAWLAARFPEQATALAGLLHKKLAQRDWEDEEAQWNWLCSLPPKLDAAQMQLELTDDSGDPQPLAEVRLALERCDDRDLPFLTAVFVATYMPSLPQYDFAEAVRGLLGKRTRIEDPSSPASGDSSMPPREIELAAEWQRLGRALWHRAHLELKVSPGGASLVQFRATSALSRLRRELDASPLFLHDQLEHLRNAGLLFHPRQAVSDAVIELLAGVAARDPSRLDAGWVLSILKQHRLALGKVTAEDTIDVEDTWGSHKLSCVFKLLRRLLDSTAGQGVATMMPGQPRTSTPGKTMVFQILEGMMESGQRLAAAGLTLAFNLRSAPGVEIWRWLRQAFEQKSEELHDRATLMLEYLANDSMEGPRVLRALFHWLVAEKNELSAAGQAALKVIASGLAQSLRPTTTTTAANGATSATANDMQCPAALVELLLAQLPGVHHEPALELAPKTILSTLATRLSIEQEVGLVDLIILHTASAELPEATLKPRADALRQQLEKSINEHWITMPIPENKGALRLALILTGWHLAHPSHDELWRAMAMAAAQVLGPSRKLIQRWISVLREALLESETDSTGEPLVSAAQRRWLLELRSRRRALAELTTWLEPDSGLPAQPFSTSTSTPSA